MVANVTALCHVLSIFVFWVIVVVVPAVGNVVAVSIILDAVVADSIITVFCSSEMDITFGFSVLSNYYLVLHSESLI